MPNNLVQQMRPQQQLALLLRILARQGYDDKLAGHISYKDCEDGSLLVNPNGIFWKDVCAKDILRVDSNAKVIEGVHPVNPTIYFHTELHKARLDIGVAIHNHPPYGTIWAAAAELPPLLDQTGANGGGKAVLYDDYEGAVLKKEIAAEQARHYGDADMAILVQHGVLVTGANIGLTLVRALCFEWRCRKAYEVRCASLNGRELPQTIADELAVYAQEYGDMLFEAYGQHELAIDPRVLE